MADGLAAAVTIAHTARLPHGYVAEFSWRPPAGLHVQWTPGVPVIRSRRHRARFLRAYVNERAVFLQMVASVAGYGIAVVDAGGHELAGLGIITPPTRQ